MHPLDLLKVRFQVSTQSPTGGIGTQMWNSLKDIQAKDGWRGLYRGVGPNIAGNASSWGLYFLLCVASLLLLESRRTNYEWLSRYNMLKKRASGDDINYVLTSSQYLLCSAQASPPTFSVDLVPSVSDKGFNLLRCRYRNGDKSHLGCQNTHVYFPC